MWWSLLLLRTHTQCLWLISTLEFTQTDPFVDDVYSLWGEFGQEEYDAWFMMCDFFFSSFVCVFWFSLRLGSLFPLWWTAIHSVYVLVSCDSCVIRKLQTNASARKELQFKYNEAATRVTQQRETRRKEIKELCQDVRWRLHLMFTCCNTL